MNTKNDKRPTMAALPMLLPISFALLASGCVEERVVHDRPVVVERREVIQEEVVAPRPPPERVVEVLPAPRPGYVWARGYWRWTGYDYVAVPGHWEVVRPGYRYVHPHWERRNDGWHWRVGVWVAN